MKRNLRLYLMATLCALFITGCGDNNLFSGLADDDSEEVMREDAQAALNSGDCETALILFSQLQAANQSDVPLRVDLSGALLCSAGIDMIGFLEVIADFGSGTIGGDQIFFAVASRSVGQLSSTWPEDFDNAKSLLAVDSSQHPPAAFQNDPEAAFRLAIIELLQSVLIVVDILNVINGSVECASMPIGSPQFLDCQISLSDSDDAILALEDASSLTGDLGIIPDVANLVDGVLTDIDAVDAAVGDPIVCDDLVSYLTVQGFNTAEVSCI